jgi:phosphoenolpyruvate synthase/pyruvate phosphate dikinase
VKWRAHEELRRAKQTVVARGMGQPCVSGAGAIPVDDATQTMIVGGDTLKRGDILTIDGGNGQVLQGAIAMVKPELTGEFATLMGWADAVRRMKVRANAETPDDARVARSFGAEGIGVPTVNSIRLALQRESDDALSHGRHAQTDLVGSHRAVPIESFA